MKAGSVSHAAEVESQERVDRLYEAHAVGLARSIQRRFALSAADAEDVVQDAFVKLLRAGEGVRSPEPWLRYVTSRLAVQSLRNRAIGGFLEEVHALSKSSSRESDRNLALEVADILDSLPALWAEILRIRYLEGRSSTETAAQVGLTGDNVRQITSRALRLIRARWR
jgi:RNA polymerase sigma-70 factor, ECF subfamily